MADTHYHFLEWEHVIRRAVNIYQLVSFAFCFTKLPPFDNRISLVWAEMDTQTNEAGTLKKLTCRGDSHFGTELLMALEELVIYTGKVKLDPNFVLHLQVSFK